MTDATMTRGAVAPIPVNQALPWAVFGTLLFAMFLYFIGAEQGATAVVQGDMIHEFVHDARHLLGFPCH
jgi:hypothetical protein